MNIKKFLVGVSAGALMLGAMAVPALAAGAQQIPWNLSAAVMPVPPYGSLDIPGSNTASKLIFNQPNGKVKAMVTGVMNGLHPDTTYTVYLSNSYTPYIDTGWNLNGVWGLNFNSTLYAAGNPYAHSVNISGSTATGSSTGNTYTATVSVTGNSVTIVATYLFGSAAYPYTYTAIGTISGVGTLSGTWSDTFGDSGTWNSTSGDAVKTHTGDTGWPGQLTGTTPFTFITDSLGSGSWHYNFRTTPPNFSVWINEAGGTMLISNTITVTP